MRVQLKGVEFHRPDNYDEVVAGVRHVQWLQKRHDQTYRPDIFQLSPIDKLTHLVLHVNKYIPRLFSLADQLYQGNWLERDTFIARLTDLGIIVVSMSNVFRLPLGEFTAEKITASYNGLLAERLNAVESMNPHYQRLPKYKDDFKPLA